MLFIKPLKVITVFILAIGIVLLAGCSSNENLSTADLTSEIKSKAAFSELSTLTGDKLLSYFGFGATDVHRFTVLIGSSDETADTIAAFEVKNDEQRSAVITGISKYSAKLTSLGETIEGESKKIESRLIYELDNTIIFVICSAPTQVEKYLTDLGATPIS